MSETKQDMIFKHRFRTVTELETSVFIPAKGEPLVGVRTEGDGTVIMKLKYGDGVTPLNALPFIKDMTYDKSTTVTESVGGLVRGTALDGMEITDILELISTDYQPIELNSLTSSLPELETGLPFTGTLTLTADIENIWNVAAGNAATITSTPDIFNAPLGVGADPRFPMQLPCSYAGMTGLGEIVVTCKIYGVNGELASKTVTIPVRAPVYYGSFNASTIDANDLNTTDMTRVLRSNPNGLQEFAANRGFIAVCTLLGSVDSFLDIDFYTGQSLLNFDMSIQLGGNLTKNNGSIDLDYKIYHTTYMIPTNFKIQT